METQDVTYKRTTCSTKKDRKLCVGAPRTSVVRWPGSPKGTLSCVLHSQGEDDAGRRPRDVAWGPRSPTQSTQEGRDAKPPIAEVVLVEPAKGKPEERREAAGARDFGGEVGAG